MTDSQKSELGDPGTDPWAEALFVACTRANRLMDAAQATAQAMAQATAKTAAATPTTTRSGAIRRRPTFSDLARYAASPDPDPDMEAALAGDPRLRRDFSRLLDRVATLSMPRLAAAATEAVNHRETPICTIDLVPSRGRPNMMIIVIKIKDRTMKVPTVLYLRRDDEVVGKWPLPGNQDASFQILAETESPLVTGLQDLDAEIVMR